MVQRFTITSQQKAAAILIAMGKDHARNVLNHMKSDEMRAILQAGRSLGTVSQVELKTIVAEFEHAFIEGTGIVDSREAINELMGTDKDGKAITDERTANDNADSEPEATTDDNQDVWQKIDAIEEIDIAERLTLEPDYLVSAVLTKLQPAKAAAVLSQLPHDRRAKIMTGMLALDDKRADSLKAIRNQLAVDFKLGDKQGGAVNPRIPEILNTLSPEDCDALLSSLKDKMAERDYALLERQLFRFDDVVKLEKAERTLLLDSLNADLLTDALRGASDELKEAVLSAIGQRMRKMIEGELAGGGNFDQKKGDEARRSIAQLAVKMASEGKFEMPKRAA